MKRHSAYYAIYFVLFLTSLSVTAEKICVIGTGYVGLVSGVCLAHLDNIVTCADIDEKKIDILHKGEIPILEPQLDVYTQKAIHLNRLTFTTNIAQAIQDNTVIFVCVGTPMDSNGSANLRALTSVMKSIAQNLNSYKTIVIKSTVPIGTCKELKEMFLKANISPDKFDIVSNPEFLREGSAVHDFLNPDRIIFGTDSEKALHIMKTIYQPLLNKNIPYLTTNFATAESIKYASNAFLAIKVSFINELANLCEKSYADVHMIAKGLGLDKRISPYFLKPGPGYGGSCFPKDTHALVKIAQTHNVHLHTVQAAIDANMYQQKRATEKLLRLCNNNLEQKTVAVLGLSFKPNTDDIRYSPAITTIKELLAHNAHVQTYDPAAMENMKKMFPTITYCASVSDALQGADAVIILTDWQEFKHINWPIYKSKKPAIVDMRNIYVGAEIKKLGYPYCAIGEE